jgi:hypothetical protein
MPEDEFNATVDLHRSRRECIVCAALFVPHSASDSSAGPPLRPGASSSSSLPRPAAESPTSKGGGGGGGGGPPAASRDRPPMLERPFAHALLDHRGYTELKKDHARDMRLRERMAYWRRSKQQKLAFDNFATELSVAISAKCQELRSLFPPPPPLLLSLSLFPALSLSSPSTTLLTNHLSRSA